MIDAVIRAEVESRLGTVLARKYRIERVLGIGGMGAVYAATHRNGGRVAIKVLHRAYSTREDVLKRFLREGSLANRVGHPAVVRIVDDDVAGDGSAFLVMELLRGETCRELADRRGGRLEPGDALVVAHRVLGALAAAHREGVIHRDIKPNNVFVTSAGEVKLLDFGIARLREGDALHDGATRTGMTLGTPGFMCPEQALGHTAKIDARADIWGMGATLFNLLTGEQVHAGSTAQEVVVLTATRPARKLGDVLDIDPRIAALVDRALALAPGDRFQRAEEMRIALEHAYAEAFDARSSIADASVAGPTSDRDLLGHAPPLDAAWARARGADVSTIDPAGGASVALPTRGASVDAASPLARITTHDSDAAIAVRRSRRGRAMRAMRLGGAGAALVALALAAAALRREPAPLPSASQSVAAASAFPSPAPERGGAPAVAAASDALVAPRALGDASAPTSPATTVAAGGASPEAGAPAVRRPKRANGERPKTIAGGENARGSKTGIVAADANAPPPPANAAAPRRDVLHDLDFR